MSTNLDGSLVSSRDLRLSLDELVELGDIRLDLLPEESEIQRETMRVSSSSNEGTRERERNERRRLTS